MSVAVFLAFPPSPPKVQGYLLRGSIIWLLVYLFIYFCLFHSSTGSSVRGALVGLGTGGRGWVAGCGRPVGCLSTLGCDHGPLGT